MMGPATPAIAVITAITKAITEATRASLGSSLMIGYHIAHLQLAQSTNPLTETNKSLAPTVIGIPAGTQVCGLPS